MADAGLLIDPGRPLAPAWRDDDFPDWLSPMLVRELRQAVRSGVFRWGFLSVHLVMGLLMAYAVLHPQRVSVDAIGWGVLGLVLGVGLPLRGLAAIHDERHALLFTVSGFVVLVLALVSRPWSRDLRRTWRLVAEASAA